MPKKPSVRKGAAAQYQNWKAVKAAVDGKQGLNFLSVMKAMGNGYFQLCSQDGILCQGTPRGLFGKGPMRIDVGQIVITEGDYIANAGSKARVVEIVGVIKEMQEAEGYVREGRMPAKVLERAIIACSVADPEEHKKKALAAVAESVIFGEEEGEEGEEAKDDDDEPAEGEDELAKGGVKQSREKAATKRAISSRAALLMKGGGGSAVRVQMGEEMDARALAEGDLHWQPPKLRRAKPKPLLPAYVEPVEATPVEDAAGMGFGLYGAGGCQVASEERKASARAAEEERLLSKAHVLRAKLAAAPVRENWDDGDVDINDL